MAIFDKILEWAPAIGRAIMRSKTVRTLDEAGGVETTTLAKETAATGAIKQGVNAVTRDEAENNAAELLKSSKAGSPTPDKLAERQAEEQAVAAAKRDLRGTGNPRANGSRADDRQFHAPQLAQAKDGRIGPGWRAARRLKAHAAEASSEPTSQAGLKVGELPPKTGFFDRPPQLNAGGPRTALINLALQAVKNHPRVAAAIGVPAAGWGLTEGGLAIYHGVQSARINSNKIETSRQEVTTSTAGAVEAQAKARAAAHKPGI